MRPLMARGECSPILPVKSTSAGLFETDDKPLMLPLNSSMAIFECGSIDSSVTESIAFSRTNASSCMGIEALVPVWGTVGAGEVGNVHLSGDLHLRSRFVGGLIVRCKSSAHPAADDLQSDMVFEVWL